ncbi:hypothetical protein [Hymenobacter jeollabukensis]|uniref:Uncharacterized protein n=1 Tax=Hymenobacter jeollabukensis TaxID=2025313 RepID=A0A5R8WS84_9BACT|nr:hypothetical protein [Hymenobacter jeollabukensis]TLM93282.1 hypothetical protein FDY95_11730 [Hymenobacter jeollabukensis]
MISTKNYAALPEPATLQPICRAMAVLDAINSPDWEYRYHSYDPAWGENEAVFQLNTGEGDEMLILFRPEGCCINGYVDTYAQPDKAQVTQGLPAVFEEFVFGEPVSSIGTTFCLWYTPAQGWQTGAIDQAADDGSEEMLYLLDARPESYAEWANEYFVEDTGRPLLSVADVTRVYQGEALTRDVVQRLNPELEQEDLEALAAELQEIGYPYSFSA